MANKALLFLFLAIPLILCCNSQLQLSSTDLHKSRIYDTGYQLMGNWNSQLAVYRARIPEALEEIGELDDYSSTFGRGKKKLSGTGTFYGEGAGMAKLAGVGIISGSIDGSILVKRTGYINIEGLVFISEESGYKMYSGTGYFTATSDCGQYIEVIVLGEGWTLAAGKGMVAWSANGWAFWYL